MAKCKDCVHFVVCQFYTESEEEFQEVGGCELFMPAADVVEVVRCADCQHWKKDVVECIDFIGRCKWANYMVSASDYCSYGIAKIEGEE